MATSRPTIGLDLGDRNSSLCVLDSDGKGTLRDEVSTSPHEVTAWFQCLPAARVVLGAGSQSP